MNDDITSISFIITLVVIISLALSYGILFFLYYKYYIKCLENKIIKETIKICFHNKKDKIINVISKITTYACYTFIAFVFILALINKQETGLTKYFSNNYLLVKSSSMEIVNKDNIYIKENNLKNQIRKYSLICLDTDYEMKLYDIYAFYDDKENIIIHRLISINDDGTYTFKGDANKDSFSYEINISKDKIIAKYNNYSSYILGVLFMYIKSNIGIISFSIAFLLIIYFEIIEYLITKHKKIKKQL